MSTVNTQYMLIIEYSTPIILTYVLQFVQQDVRFLVILWYPSLLSTPECSHENDRRSAWRLLVRAEADNPVSQLTS